MDGVSCPIDSAAQAGAQWRCRDDANFTVDALAWSPAGADDAPGSLDDTPHQP